MINNSKHEQTQLVMIKILQGSTATQTVLCGLSIHLPVASFVQSICAKNHESCFTLDKVIVIIIRPGFFLVHPVCQQTTI